MLFAGDPGFPEGGVYSNLGELRAAPRLRLHADRRLAPHHHPRRMGPLLHPALRAALQQLRAERAVQPVGGADRREPGRSVRLRRRTESVPAVRAGASRRRPPRSSCRSPISTSIPTGTSATRAASTSPSSTSSRATWWRAPPTSARRAATCRRSRRSIPRIYGPGATTSNINNRRPLAPDLRLDDPDDQWRLSRTTTRSSSRSSTASRRALVRRELHLLARRSITNRWRPS